MDDFYICIKLFYFIKFNFIFLVKRKSYDPTYNVIPDNCRDIYQLCDIDNPYVKKMVKEALENKTNIRTCTV